MSAWMADRIKDFGTSIFTEMSALAAQHDAINLAQGFPDFAGPAFVKDAACAAIHAPTWCCSSCGRCAHSPRSTGGAR